MAKIRWVNNELRVYSRWWVVFNARWKHLRSKKENIEWFWKTNPSLVHDALKFLKGYCKNNNYRNIISFGSGLCTLEYLLWEYLSKHCSDAFMVASDVDKRVIDVASRLFPKINCLEFDFYKHDYKRDILSKFDVDYDLCFMIDSTYSMNEKAFVSFYNSLRENGVSNVIDFCGGIVKHKRYAGKRLYRINNGLRYMVDGVLPNPERYIPDDSPYGYARTKDDLRRLFDRAGYRVVDEPEIDGLRYVAVLKDGRKW